MPDTDPKVNWDNSQVLRHFTHFALQRAGIALGLRPEEAHPVPWPDFHMNARPALPPIHPNWEEEKRNLIEWFTYLWQWQGGDEGPEWNKIMRDINNGRFQYIEQKRLPAAFLPFVHPKDWGEAMTWSWSWHIRSTMDEWGRALRSKGDTAMQFRLIDYTPDEQATTTYDTFVDDVHPSSPLVWTTPALLFEKRIRKAMRTPAPRSSEQASALYDNTAPLLQEAECAIESSCKSSQSGRVNLAPHGAHEFPDEFVFVLQDGHHSWAPAALLGWLKTNPFWDQQADGLIGGFSGIAVAFYAILHYAINILRVAPKNSDEEDSMVERDLRIYGHTDYQVLAQCTRIVQDQVDKSAQKHPLRLRQIDTDREGRYTPWKPEVWMQFNAHGDKEHLPDSHLTAPKRNLFEFNLESTEDEGGSQSGSENSAGYDTSKVDVDAAKEINMIDLVDEGSDNNSPPNSSTVLASKDNPSDRAGTDVRDVTSQTEVNQTPQSGRTEQSVHTSTAGPSPGVEGDVTMSDTNASPVQTSKIAAESTPASATRRKHAGEQDRSGARDVVASEGGTSRDASVNAIEGQQASGAVGTGGVPDGLPEQAVDLLRFAQQQAQLRAQSGGPGGGSARTQRGVGAGGATTGNSGRNGARKVSGDDGGRPARGTKRPRNKGSVENSAQENSKKSK
ncbi:hypothetical protein FS749_006172 [Ceratobasidium sp. UAMH 11750]|nr:hypothetical protein FS749_006172 [Ceratobasidium sp. UAMH 11750]